MSQTAAHDVSTTPAVLRPIETTRRWDDAGGTDPLRFNVVHLADAAGAEVTAFNTLLNDPANEMVADFPVIWDTTFALLLQIYSEIIPLAMEISTDINAEYLIGRSDDPDNLGAAFSPQQFFDNGLTQETILFNAAVFLHTQAAETGGGNDLHLTSLHEIGHALGLAHPHGADDGSTSTNVAEDDQVPPYQWHHTLISYTPPPNTQVPVEAADTLQSSFGRAVAPMALDIATLHRMYGANTTTRTGDSTYTLTDTATTALDLTGETISVGRAYYGIWDAGTADTDTIQYTGANATLINLNTATLATPPADVAAQITELQTHALFNALDATTRTEITNNTATAGGFFSSVLDTNGVRIQGGYSIANGVVIENATGGSGNDVLIGNGAANTLTGNDGRDLLHGGAGNDVLNSGIGDDVLIGGTGADTMNGGAGNDRIFIDNTGDVIIEGVGEGFEWVDTTVSRTLEANVDAARAAGNGAVDLTGNADNNWLIGNAAINSISGGAGNDRMAGGAGADVFVAQLDDGTNLVTDFVVGTDRMDISALALSFGDLIIRDSANGALVIYDQNGAVGQFVLAGINAADLNAASFIEAIAAPRQIIGTAGNDVLLGGAGNESISGLAGNDFLLGGGGDDTMIGGAGDDVFIVNSLADQVVEDAGAAAGYDRALVEISDTLDANVEAGNLLGVNQINLTGNASDNWLNGNSANNNLSGLTGNDRLDGNGGNDVLDGGAGNDVLEGGAGFDTFVFERTDGTDLILDYSVADDAINFGNGLTFADLTVAQSGANVTIAYGADLITVLNAQASDFVEAEFNFFPTEVG